MMTTVTGTALMVLGLAVNAGVLVSCVRQVWRFNVRLPELWRLLESKGRAHRVRELHDEPRTNLPSAKYLYDEVDFDDRDIRELKLTLKGHATKCHFITLFFGVVMTGTLALYERVA